MRKILVKVYLPATQQEYEMSIPAAMNCYAVAVLASKAIASLSDGMFSESKSSAFAWKTSGKLLDMNSSMENDGVKNGSSLILI